MKIREKTVENSEQHETGKIAGKSAKKRSKDSNTVAYEQRALTYFHELAQKVSSVSLQG